MPNTFDMTKISRFDDLMDQANTVDEPLPADVAHGLITVITTKIFELRNNNRIKWVIGPVIGGRDRMSCSGILTNDHVEPDDTDMAEVIRQTAFYFDPQYILCGFESSDGRENRFYVAVLAPYGVVDFVSYLVSDDGSLKLDERSRMIGRHLPEHVDARIRQMKWDPTKKRGCSWDQSSRPTDAIMFSDMVEASMKSTEVMILDYHRIDLGLDSKTLRAWMVYGARSDGSPYVREVPITETTIDMAMDLAKRSGAFCLIVRVIGPMLQFGNMQGLHSAKSSIVWCTYISTGSSTMFVSGLDTDGERSPPTAMVMSTPDLPGIGRETHRWDTWAPHPRFS